MSAELRSGGGTGDARWFVECRPCGWTRPVSGFVRRTLAGVYRAEHNCEVHGLSGDCETDCQERCAYPGQFSECSEGVEG